MHVAHANRSQLLAESQRPIEVRARRVELAAPFPELAQVVATDHLPDRGAERDGELVALAQRLDRAGLVAGRSAGVPELPHAIRATPRAEMPRRDLAAGLGALEGRRLIAVDGVALATEAVQHGEDERRFADVGRSSDPGIDALGRVIVDAALRVPGAPEIFVAGDAAAADTGDGHPALQSCQHAGQLGRVAGENAARDLFGEVTVPYRQLRYVTCLDLGRAGAVVTEGWERRVEKTGSAAKAVKRLINTYVLQLKMLATRLGGALDPNVVLALQCLNFHPDWRKLYDLLAADPQLFQKRFGPALRDPEPPAAVWMSGAKVAIPTQFVDYLRGPAAPLLNRTSRV